MIERNNRYVSLRKYGTAFLDAFGFFALDYFGCVGDNLTDNYANLQVAIDESIKKGLRYIFVPNGTYYFTGVLDNIEEIIFIGNAKYAKVYSDKTEILIYQIGTQLPFEKGITTLEKEVTSEGYIDIPVKTKNGSEAILVANEKVIHVIDELITVDGKLATEPNLTGGDVYISDVQIMAEAIRVFYNGSGNLNMTVEWRLR